MTTAVTLLRQLLVNGTLPPDYVWSTDSASTRPGPGPGQWSETTATGLTPPPPPPLLAVDTASNGTAAAASASAVAAVVAGAKNIYNQSLLNIGRWLAAGNATRSSTYGTDSGSADDGVALRVAGEVTDSTTAAAIATDTAAGSANSAAAVAAKVTAAVADAVASVTATSLHDRASLPYTDDYDVYAQMWGDNLTFWNASGNATPTVSDDGGVPAPAYWALLLLIFPVLTVFGNVLVVLSVYCERSLRSPTNYFIVSLAVADIMVAVLVMPLAVYVEVSASLPLVSVLLMPSCPQSTYAVFCAIHVRFFQVHPVFLIPPSRPCLEAGVFPSSLGSSV